MLVKDIVINSANEQKIRQNQTEKEKLLSDDMFSYKI